MDSFANINQKQWEQRGEEYPNNIKGVLFKKFPESLNAHIDNWHQQMVLENIPDEKNLRILDIGCGYGRISIPVLQRNNTAEIVGIDISHHFIEQFKKNTGQQGIVGFIEDMSGDIGSFDIIICVTVLMYIEKNQLENVFSKMFSLLRNDGTIILIEPIVSGKYFSNGFGLLNLFRTKKKQLKENCFKPAILKKMIVSNGGAIVSEKRLPFTSIFIVPLYCLSKILNETIMNPILRIIRKADKVFSKSKLPSIHILFTIKKVF